MHAPFQHTARRPGVDCKPGTQDLRERRSATQDFRVPKLSIPFRDIELSTLPDFGGKNAALASSFGLVPAGARVPDGDWVP